MSNEEPTTQDAVVQAAAQEAPAQEAPEKTAAKKKKQKKKFKSSSLRIATSTIALVAFALAIIVGVSIGTLCGYGYEDLAMMCPLGALTSMIATRTVVPHAVIVLVIGILIIFVFGRVFCGWVCPIPLLKRVKRFFTPAKSRRKKEQQALESVQKPAKEKLACKGDCGSSAACKACMPKQYKFDGRHVVLGGAVVSTAIFGFPVFCIICPIGLTFGTILVIYRLFAFGDATITALIIPLILLIEVFGLRKWCTKFCPLSALMDLFARFSRTTHPVIDNAKCIETQHGHACSRCAAACPEGINLRNPEFGENTIKDCTRCRECVDVCPEHAIKMPAITPKEFLQEHKAPQKKYRIDVRAAKN